MRDKIIVGLIIGTNIHFFMIFRSCCFDLSFNKLLYLLDYELVDKWFALCGINPALLLFANEKSSQINCLPRESELVQEVNGIQLLQEYDA